MVILLLLWRAEGYHQSAGHLSPFIHECRTYYLNSRFKQFSDVNLEHINIPLQRLKNAIFERSHPEDAIVDAIIAWEGMFSEAFETSFKVTASMAKYLAEPADRDEFYQRLRKLYALRSDIVHGKKSKLMTRANCPNMVVNALKADVRVAVVEVHVPRVGKVVGMGRRRPIKMIRRIRKDRRIYGGACRAVIASQRHCFHTTPAVC